MCAPSISRWLGLQRDGEAQPVALRHEPAPTDPRDGVVPVEVHLVRERYEVEPRQAGEVGQVVAPLLLGRGERPLLRVRRRPGAQAEGGARFAGHGVDR